MKPNTFKVYPTYLVACQVNKKERVRFAIKNERTNTKGVLSELSKRKIKRAVNNLTFISPEQERQTDLFKKFTFKMNFITLTLPASQNHEDKVLKAALDDFLNHFRKKGLMHYIWVAEKQKNGSIHFHLTTNYYIHHTDVRSVWNGVLRRLGYIEDYRNAQLEWHKDGFKIRPELLKKGWTKERQELAYQRGMAENWTNPNTTDIHKIKKIKNLSNYLIKYLTKGGDDKIVGRLWGCSRNLLLQPEEVILDYLKADEFYKDNRHLAVAGDDFWEIIPINENDIAQNFWISRSLDEFRNRLLKE